MHSWTCIKYICVYLCATTHSGNFRSIMVWFYWDAVDNFFSPTILKVVTWSIFKLLFLISIISVFAEKFYLVSFLHCLLIGRDSLQIAPAFIINHHGQRCQIKIILGDPWLQCVALLNFDTFNSFSHTCNFKELLFHRKILHYIFRRYCTLRQTWICRERHFRIHPLPETF